MNNSFLNKNNILVNLTSIDTNLVNLTIYLFNSTELINETTTNINNSFLNFINLADGWYSFNSTACDILNQCNFTIFSFFKIHDFPPRKMYFNIVLRYVNKNCRLQIYSFYRHNWLLLARIIVIWYKKGHEYTRITHKWSRINM